MTAGPDTTARMLVEQRTYTTHPGQWRAYLSLYEAKGLAIQRRILGRMVGYYRTETGPLNQVIHMWAYVDMNERAERRELLMADPAWKAYVVEMLPLLQSQESKILLPAPFFTPRWQD
ncbi:MULTISPECIES: NIPSNAP family protein [unclassified Variovorax]|uniref:NIPSNAP family protein n=2 Tax=Variovorax TaxID=34072 RepID=UPI000899BA64|nr:MULTISPECIES: NIPSNAP family protein [unclassified Variovorax]SDZ36459.1 NIPSNAP protein [Variovorax sp. YR634]SOD29242.1 NIPSNAP protein [Variovorax sp. YR752]